MTRFRLFDLVLIALFAALMALCSWIAIPATVPFTLQTFGVFVAVGTLGGRRGSLAVLVYLLLGAVGAPVFANFQGGVGYLLGSTGGYAVGFLFSALVMWLFERLFGRARWVQLCSMVVGLLVCYALGTAWFMLVYARTTGTIGLWTALLWCVIPFIVPDLVKLALAHLVSQRLAAILRNFT